MASEVLRVKNSSGFLPSNSNLVRLVVLRKFQCLFSCSNKHCFRNIVVNNTYLFNHQELWKFILIKANMNNSTTLILCPINWYPFSSIKQYQITAWELAHILEIDCRHLPTDFVVDNSIQCVSKLLTTIHCFGWLSTTMHAVSHYKKRTCIVVSNLL